MQRILKSMNAFIKVVKVATTLQMGSFPGALTEMESHPDELIICISYAETEWEGRRQWVRWTVGDNNWIPELLI